MKKAVLILTGALLLASCNNGSGGSHSNQTSKQSWTISFNSNGGSEVTSIKVEDGQKASKPADPTKEGYSFLSWCVDSYLTTSFDWDSSITADWTLNASWEKSEDPISSSDDENSSSGDDTTESSTSDTASSEEESSSDSSSGEEDSSSDSTSDGGDSSDKKGHGPEGSTLVSWYLVGSGSLWESSTGWTTAGGIQLFSNPKNASDKGCLLGVTFADGDQFKVTDGTTWLGYDKIDNVDSTAFESADGANKNIKCKTAKAYDIYVNAKGALSIQASN